MRSKVLVTGGSGFLGSAVCRELTAAGFHVLVPTRRPLTVIDPLLEALPVHDLSRLSTDHGDRFASIGCVVHCAGRAHQLADSADDPLAAFRAVNRDVTIALASAAMQAGVPRFIFISSVGVNGSASCAAPFTEADLPKPDTPYAISKWEAEQELGELAARSGMQLFVLRPPMIYGRGAPGNFALLAKLVRTGLPLPFGAMHAPRSFVAIQNIVDLIRFLVSAEGAEPGTYLVSDGEIITTTRFVRHMIEAAETRSQLIPVPVKMLEWAAFLAGRTDQVRKMAVPLAIDITLVRDRLGWSPSWRIDAAMQAALGATS